jgi:small subunit ribosomal protein S6
MSVELYETMFLVDANKMASDGETIRTALATAIEKQGGDVLVSRPWDDRKIAYNIRRANTTHKKGSYYIIYYKMESTKQVPLEQDLRLTTTDFLLRHLTSHVDHRWADTILEIAKGEQGPGFALRTMQDDTNPADMNPSTINDPMAGGFDGGAPAPREGGGGGGRRPRRGGDDKPE